MAICCVCTLTKSAIDALRNVMAASEDAKYELREEVEFTLARLNAAARHVRHALQMYTRDSAACLRAGEEAVARQLITQKLLAERRADQIAIQVGLLESVGASLHPGLRRCRGDLLMCRAILDKCADASMTPEVLNFMDTGRRSVDGGEDGVAPQAVEDELNRLWEAVQRPFTSTTAEAPYALQPTTAFSPPTTAAAAAAATATIVATSATAGSTVAASAALLSATTSSTGAASAALLFSARGDVPSCSSEERQRLAADPFGVAHLVKGGNRNGVGGARDGARDGARAGTGKAPQPPIAMTLFSGPEAAPPAMMLETRSAPEAGQPAEAGGSGDGSAGSAGSTGRANGSLAAALEAHTLATLHAASSDNEEAEDEPHALLPPPPSRAPELWRPPADLGAGHDEGAEDPRGLEAGARTASLDETFLDALQDWEADVDGSAMGSSSRPSDGADALQLANGSTLQPRGRALQPSPQIGALEAKDKAGLAHGLPPSPADRAPPQPTARQLFKDE